MGFRHSICTSRIQFPAPHFSQLSLISSGAFWRLGSNFPEPLPLWAIPVVSCEMMSYRLDVIVLRGFLALWSYALGYFLNLCKLVFLYVRYRIIVRHNNYSVR